MHTSKNLDLTAIIVLLTLAAVWGGSFFFAEIALRELSPLTITLHRVLWAVPILGLVVWFKKIALPKSPRVWGAYLVMGALNNAIPFSLIFWGQKTIESGLASILNGTTAMFGAVVAGILLADEPLTKNKIIGALVGLVGVTIIIGPDAIYDFDLSNLAQLAILLASFSYALASVWGKTKLASQPPLMNALGMLIGSTILMIPIAIVFSGLPRIDLLPTTWGALLGLSSLSTALAYVLYFAILIRAGAANLMLVTLLIPPFAIGLGTLFLGERLGVTAISGFVIIAIGLIITDGRIVRIGLRQSS